MPTGILKFKLPEEQEEFTVAQKACDYKAALDDVYERIIRRRRKYAELTDEQSNLIEEIALEYAEIRDEYELK